MEELARGYVSSENEVADVEEALAGARDIIAEQVADHPETRTAVRKIYEESSQVGARVVASKKNEPEAAKYRDYFDFDEPIDKIPSHRLLAIRRGESEGFLKLGIHVTEDEGVRTASREFLPGPGLGSGRAGDRGWMQTPPFSQHGDGDAQRLPETGR